MTGAAIVFTRTREEAGVEREREWASGSTESDQAEDKGRGHDKELHPFPNANLFQKESQQLHV